MSLKGKLSLEVVIQSSPDKFYEAFCTKPHQIPNLCSHRIPEIKLHEGDWHEHGSVKHWTYVLPDGTVESGKERVTHDKKNKTLTLEFIEGDPLKDYKVYTGILNVLPSEGEGGGRVKWTLVYERRTAGVPPPFTYLTFALHLTEDVDAGLVKSSHLV